MDRRLYTLIGVLAVASLVVLGTGTLWQRPVVTAEQTGRTGELPAWAAEKLPPGTTLLASAESAEVRGVPICGHCRWGAGEGCNIIVWDRENGHAVLLLPGEKTTELQALAGACPAGNLQLVARGGLSEAQGLNYLQMTSFEATATSAEPAGSSFAHPEGPMTVAELVREGVAARYERGDIAGARKLWEEAVARLDEPQVTPLDRYQALAGLGLIHGEAGEYSQAAELYHRAVEASREITDNLKPLSYSYYNLACAHGYLGDNEAALAALRSSLEAEARTERRRYVKMAAEAEAFVSVRSDPRFAALIAEFDGPPPPDASCSCCGGS